MPDNYVFVTDVPERGRSTENMDRQRITYSELIPSPTDFTGEKFRTVLESHGLTVMDTGNNTRMIKLDAHGDFPDMYIAVPAAGHNFDRRVFSEVPEEYKDMYANTTIPQYPIENRLRFLNTLLTQSGYVGEQITLDMLNSREPLNLAPGLLAVKELEQYKENKVAGLHNDSFYFNNPEGEQERLAARNQRTQENFAIAEHILNARKEEDTTLVHEEDAVQKALSVISLDEKTAQKLMVLENTHRLKFLDMKFPEAGISKLTVLQQERFLDAIEKNILNIETEPNTEEKTEREQQTSYVRYTTSVVGLASANFAAEIKDSEEQGQAITKGVGRS